jgi:hypothetical protein
MWFTCELKSLVSKYVVESVYPSYYANPEQHKHVKWQKRIRPVLHATFAKWFHVVCKEKLGSR